MPCTVLLALVFAAAALQDMRGELDVSASALAVSPAGDLWIGSRDGRVFVSRDWNQSWSEVEIGSHATSGGKWAGEEIAHIRFFDAERAILAGTIGQETRNEILRSTDGGRSWTRVPLGVPQGPAVSVSDAQVFADGHAWLAGSTGLLASQDFGATWRHVPEEPFEGAARCCTVCFRTPELGVVGTDGNALNRTNDGGCTWTWLATPIDDLYPALARAPQLPELRAGKEVQDIEERWRVELERRVQGVWCLGERLLVLQHGRLFQRPFVGEENWRAIELGGREVALAAYASERLLVVTDDLRVWWLSSALEISSACDAPLENSPSALAAGARGIAFLAFNRTLCTLENGVLSWSLFHPRDRATWPISAFDRAADGVLFGVSVSSLYRSRDEGQSWERLAEGGSLRDVWAARDGEHALVITHDEVRLWRGGAELEPVPLSAKRLHRASILRARAGSLWIATAFEAAEDEETQRMLRSSDTTLAGPGFRALLFSSLDEGQQWQRIAEHSGAIVRAAWLGDDGWLRLCLSDGTIRGGTIDTREGTLAGGELALVSSADHHYGGQWGTWLAFPDVQTGWVGGSLFFEGGSLARTTDGGRTWQEREPESEAWAQAFRLGSGACVRIVRSWSEDHRVELAGAGEFSEIRRFETEVHDARVDAEGRLLVRLKSGEVWSLAADGVAWLRLGTIPVPSR